MSAGSRGNGVIAVIDYGMGNLRSVSKALEHVAPDARIVVTSGQASISYLQRRLRIGYPRAARIMEQLEEEGIVNPSDRIGGSREVVAADDDDFHPDPGMDIERERF